MSDDEVCFLCDGRKIVYVFKRTNGRVPYTIECPECTEEKGHVSDVLVLVLVIIALFVMLAVPTGIEIAWNWTPITIPQ